VIAVPYIQFGEQESRVLADLLEWTPEIVGVAEAHDVVRRVVDGSPLSVGDLFTLRQYAGTAVAFFEQMCGEMILPGDDCHAPPFWLVAVDAFQTIAIPQHLAAIELIDTAINIAETCSWRQGRTIM